MNRPSHAEAGGSSPAAPVRPWGLWAWEFWGFVSKEAQACLFAGLFFAAVFCVPRAGLWGLPRYDLLLLIALLIQTGMVLSGRESRDELKAIGLFHLLGFALEVFKTSAAVQSWSYPDFAYTKLFGVPLFAGFMYAAVGSYIIQAWRLLQLRVIHHPPYWMAGLMALAIYLNFFTQHVWGDVRWYLAAGAMGLYARSQILFRPQQRELSMPLWLGLVLVAFFIWLAENLGTFFGLWSYPHQLGAWARVHMSKWSSWSLLVLISFTLVVQLKHIRERVQVPD